MFYNYYFFVEISAGLNFHVKKWQQKRKKTHLEYIFILMWMARIIFILLIKIVPRYTLKYSIFDRFYYSQQLINLNHIGHSSASYSNSTVLKWWQILLNICGNWQAFTLMHAFSYFFLFVWTTSNGYKTHFVTLLFFIDCRKPMFTCYFVLFPIQFCLFKKISALSHLHYHTPALSF